MARQMSPARGGDQRGRGSVARQMSPARGGQRGRGSVARQMSPARGGWQMGRGSVARQMSPARVGGQRGRGSVARQMSPARVGLEEVERAISSLCNSSPGENGLSALLPYFCDDDLGTGWFHLGSVPPVGHARMDLAMAWDHSDV